MRRLVPRQRARRGAAGRLRDEGEELHARSRRARTRAPMARSRSHSARPTPACSAHATARASSAARARARAESTATDCAALGGTCGERHAERASSCAGASPRSFAPQGAPEHRCDGDGARRLRSTASRIEPRARRARAASPMRRERRRPRVADRPPVAIAPWAAPPSARATSRACVQNGASAGWRLRRVRSRVRAPSGRVACTQRGHARRRDCGRYVRGCALVVLRAAPNCVRTRLGVAGCDPSGAAARPAHRPCASAAAQRALACVMQGSRPRRLRRRRRGGPRRTAPVRRGTSRRRNIGCAHPAARPPAEAHRALGSRQDVPPHRVRHAPRSRAHGARAARREAHEPGRVDAAPRDGARGHRRCTSSPALPEQMRNRLEDKLRLDGITWDSFTLKPNLSNVLRLRFRARPRSARLQAARAAPRRAPRSTVPRGRAPPADAPAARRSSATTPRPTRSSTRSTPTWSPGASTSARCSPCASEGASTRTSSRSSSQFASRIDHVDAVERIFIHLERQTPPDDFRALRLRASCRSTTTCRLRSCLHEDGRLPSESVLRVAVGARRHASLRRRRARAQLPRPRQARSPARSERSTPRRGARAWIGARARAERGGAAAHDRGVCPGTRTSRGAARRLARVARCPTTSRSWASTTRVRSRPSGPVAGAERRGVDDLDLRAERLAEAVLVLVVHDRVAEAGRDLHRHREDAEKLREARRRQRRAPSVPSRSSPCRPDSRLPDRAWRRRGSTGSPRSELSPMTTQLVFQSVGGTPPSADGVVTRVCADTSSSRGEQANALHRRHRLDLAPGWRRGETLGIGMEREAASSATSTSSGAALPKVSSIFRRPKIDFRPSTASARSLSTSPSLEPPPAIPNTGNPGAG